MPINQNATLSLSERQSQCLALFISAALFLSVSTNLRPTGLPLGIGEIGLLLLMIGSLWLKPWQAVSSPLFLFWIAVWVCTGLGYMFGSVVGNLRQDKGVAYAYTGILTLVFLTVFGRLQASDLRRILFCFVVISVLSLWIGFLAYLNLNPETLAFLRIDTSDNGRYQGWCQNANQMSLLLVPMPFLVLDLWSASLKNTTSSKAGWLTLLFLTIFMGFVVRSAALTASWGLGLAVMGFLNLKNNPRFNWKTVVAVLFIFIFAFIAVRGWTQYGILGVSERNNALQVGIGSAEEKIDIRIQLWKNGLEVWERSPVFGHGPGAYSKFEMGRVGFDGMEAHNTLIDLMVQGGLLLALAYAGLFCWLVASLYRTRQWLLLVATLTIFSFEFFMFHLRQPVIWFYLALSLALAQERLRLEISSVK